MTIELYVDKNYAPTPGSVSDDAKRIRIWAEVTNASGVPISGASVSFVVNPQKESYEFYQSDLTPAPMVGGVPTVPTDASGTATIYIVADQPASALVSADLSSGDACTPIELYFGSNNSAHFRPTWLPPSIFTKNGRLLIPSDGGYIEKVKSTGNIPVLPRTFPVFMPRSTSTVDAGGTNFLVLNNQVAIPYKPNSTGEVNVAYSDVIVNPDVTSNKISYFIQDLKGNLGQSPVLEFGVLGTYDNQPDAKQTMRMAPAPQVIPDPGQYGGIAIDLLKVNHGIHVSIPSFDTILLGKNITSLRCEVYFYMNGYQAGTDIQRQGRMYPVTVGELQIVGTTVSSFIAALDWPYAYGWSKPLHGNPLNFYCEYILKDQLDHLYLSQIGTPWPLNTADRT